MDHSFQNRLDAALARATQELLAAQTQEGYWAGELSSSALSTATAVCALALGQREGAISEADSRIFAGLNWLVQHRNKDGGWGDTTRSLSNLSTTVLGWAAFGAVPGADAKYREAVMGAERWIVKHAGSLQRPVLAPAIIRRYGKDRTFSVPILTMCALAGRLGQDQQAWRWIIPLPFELAACPHQWFAALRLPVVSYALPALIAMGQARHYHLPTGNPLVRLLRNLTRGRTLKILERIQPENGGFLEATPLTSFVTMSLAGSGQASHPVCQKGLKFLLGAQRADGSWPIDTNLATWLTTLSVNALDISSDSRSVVAIGDRPSAIANNQMRTADGQAATANGQTAKADSQPTTTESPAPTAESQSPIGKQQSKLLAWLLGQQYRVEHPYTHAAPGGWAWTDLPGGVPDADDTAGALLALRHLGPATAETREAAVAGVTWLLKLQNRDGGIPTFCRGWGALPFDRSSADLTAHALRAWVAWLDESPATLRDRISAAIGCGLAFLCRAQSADGAWLPLWFGNQYSPAEENPTYGTARVLCALTDGVARFHSLPGVEAAVTRGLQWLLTTQNDDGSWGGFAKGPASVEETALAIEALAGALLDKLLPSEPPRKAIQEAVFRGLDWLIERVESGQWQEPAPIGFYFARLWYYERLYPLIFTVSALQKAASLYQCPLPLAPNP